MNKLIAGISSPSRKQIEDFQRAASMLPQAEFETKHYFSDGMYCREVMQPKDSVVIGKVHIKPHLFMLLSGEMTIVGNGYRERVKAPYVLAADGDDKRALYAHEDSVYVTVHKTDKTNLDELEKELIKDDDRYLFDSSNRLKFDVPKFRALTLKIIANERPGFWSDWTPEQRELYASDKWEEFSHSRGYTEPQIDDFRAWLKMIVDAKLSAVDPFYFIEDLATAAALDNIRKDLKGEIHKSSRLPPV